MDFLLEYGLFFAKIVTFVIAVIILLSVIVGLSQKNKQSGHRGHLEITPLNEFYDEMSETIKFAVMDESLHKAEAKKQQKEKQKKAKEHTKMVDALKSGASVVTRGGVVGTVQSVKDTTVTVRSLESKFEVEKHAIERVINNNSDLKTDNK